MTALRVIIALLALASTIAGLLIPPPGVMAISGMAAILIFLLSFGSIAADALPLRVVPLVCSIVTMPLAVLIMVQPFSIALVSALIVVLQGVGWWGGRHGCTASARARGSSCCSASPSRCATALATGIAGSTSTDRSQAMSVPSR